VFSAVKSLLGIVVANLFFNIWVQQGNKRKSNQAKEFSKNIKDNQGYQPTTCLLNFPCFDVVCDSSFYLATIDTESESNNFRRIHWEISSLCLDS
jgi:hypothetical protein